MLSLFVYANTLFAQENTISPLFGISPSTSGVYQNDLLAINQNLGSSVTIQSFFTQNLVGLNYTVSTQASSNVDKLYFLNTPQTLKVYNLPYFFDPNYNGEADTLFLNQPVNDIVYYEPNTAFFAYQIANQNLYTISSINGQTLSTKTIPFPGSNVTDLSLQANHDFVALSGKLTDSLFVLLYNIAGDSVDIFELSTLYKDFFLVGHQTLTDFYAIALDTNNVNWLLAIDPVNENTQVIAALPSCSNCAIESFTFNKNACAVDFENNEIIAVLNQTINAVEQFNLLTISLVDGAIQQFTPLTKEVNNLYFNKAAADLVFPGDANHDGLANHLDLFPIGLRYSFNTTPRFSQNNLWIGQQAFNTGVFAQGADVKHADSNGDGQVNSLDIDAILLNYNSVHNSDKTDEEMDASCPYPLGFTFTQTAYEEGNTQINIKLGDILDSVENVYAVAFSLYYDNQFVVPNTMHTIGLNSWFGNDGNNSIHTFYDDFLNGRMDVSLTGVDLLNRSGGGDIITAAWTMEDLVVPIAQNFTNMNIRIDDVTIINLAEEELASCGMDSTLKVYKKTVGINNIANEKIQIYPNPASSQLHIQTESLKAQVVIIDHLGKTILQTACNQKLTLAINDWTTGIYLVKIVTEQGMFVQKVEKF